MPEIRPPTSTADRGAAWRPAFLALTGVFTVGMAFTTVPTPLYPIYESHEGYGTATITVIFAVYPLGVMASVLLLGHASDRVGRRRAIVPALGLEALSAVGFLLSSSLPVLLAARVVCGIGVGILTATAAAYLAELDRRARVHGPRRADLAATGATFGGFGAGALGSGLLATVAPAPLRLPFLVALIGLLVAGLVAALLPETLTSRAAGPALRLQRMVVPAHARRPYFGACAGGFASLCLLSLYASVAPSFLADSLHQRSPAVAGAVACACCFAAGLGQIALVRLAPRRQLFTALILLPAGIVMVTLAVALESFPLFLAGGIIGGLGSGGLFKRALATVDDLAPAASRAEAFAGFYLAVYLNATFPVVALGVLTQAFGALTAVSAFAVMIFLVLAVAAPSLMGAPVAMRTPAPEPEQA